MYPVVMIKGTYFFKKVFISSEMKIVGLCVIVVQETLSIEKRQISIWRWKRQTGRVEMEI